MMPGGATYTLDGAIPESSDRQRAIQRSRDEAGGRHRPVIAVVKADEVEPVMRQQANSAREDWDSVDIEIEPEDAVAEAMAGGTLRRSAEGLASRW